MKQRLLLVDDDEVFLRPLHRTLELAGYEVLPVQSGEEGLDTLKLEDVDLVLTDRRLPGMDGSLSCARSRPITPIWPWWS